MIHEARNAPQRQRQASRGATVTQLDAHRRATDVLSTITFVFGGVHFGTFDVVAPYTRGKPLMLYFVAQNDRDSSGEIAGPIDCLVTDDAMLGADAEAAR